MASVPVQGVGEAPFRRGVTPMFLYNDPMVVDRLSAALSDAMDRPIEGVRRRTYAETTGLFLPGALGAAWLCGLSGRILRARHLRKAYLPRRAIFGKTTGRAIARQKRVNRGGWLISAHGPCPNPCKRTPLEKKW